MTTQIKEFDGWNIEKTIHSLMDVARAMKTAKELQARIPLNRDSEEKRDDAFLVDEIIRTLSEALYDLTKITAFFNNLGAWEPGDRDRISDGGDHGLVDILRKYGFGDWVPRYLRNLGPEVVTDKEVIDTILHKVRDLSGGPAENRTLIYDELRNLPKNPTAAKILDLIEPVTQGEKTWGEFQIEIEALLRDV